MGNCCCTIGQRFNIFKNEKGHTMNTHEHTNEPLPVRPRHAFHARHSGERFYKVV
jgi:hypothetical protein